VNELRSFTSTNFSVVFANQIVFSNKQAIIVENQKTVIKAVESVDKILSNTPPDFKNWPDSRRSVPFFNPQVTKQ